MTRPLLITGATGLLGHHTVERALLVGHQVVAVKHLLPEGIQHPQLSWRHANLQTPGELDSLLKEVNPAAVIHTAAMSLPKDCEEDPGRATRINTTVVDELARACAHLGTRLLHVSTDLVFDGSGGPYREDAPCHPISHYGHTKRGAELAVRASGAGHVIVRTSLLAGPSHTGTRGLEELLVMQARKGEKVRLFVDEFRTPTASRDVAATLVALVSHSFEGVLNVAGPEIMNRYQLGCLVADALGFSREWFEPVRLRDAPALNPPRPPNCSLDTGLLRSLTPALPAPGPIARDWGHHPLAGKTGLTSPHQP